MLKLTELLSMEISSIKYSGDQWLSPDVPFSHIFSQMTYSPYTYSRLASHHSLLSQSVSSEKLGHDISRGQFGRHCREVTSGQ